jgi:predicted acetyltransferase
MSGASELTGTLRFVGNLQVPPRLVQPTSLVRDSYLAGEREDCIARQKSEEWLVAAADDFDAFVAARRGVQIRWGVPSTIFWYVSGEHYLGSLVIRHTLTDELAEIGGHIGYHVVAPWQRRGHATRMLAAALVEARQLGLDRVLLTCGTENEPSRRVIVANGGIYEDQRRGEDRFWIALKRADRSSTPRAATTASADSHVAQALPAALGSPSGGSSR